MGCSGEGELPQDHLPPGCPALDSRQRRSQTAFFHECGWDLSCVGAARLFEVPKVISPAPWPPMALTSRTGASTGLHPQRPITMYGSSKVFAELLGRFLPDEIWDRFSLRALPFHRRPRGQNSATSLSTMPGPWKEPLWRAVRYLCGAQIRCPPLLQDAARSVFYWLLLPQSPPHGVLPLAGSSHDLREQLVSEIRKTSLKLDSIISLIPWLWPFPQ